LPADIFARYHRLKGNNVLVVSGSDAHGTPITVEADKRGISPVEFFERYHRRFVETQKAIGISYDLFTHTRTENHRRIAQEFLRTLYAKGYLYPQTQRQHYSESEKRFLPDRYVEGTCPICGYENARGDQCDQCGNLLDAVDLIDPRSVGDGSRPVIRETRHLFLDLHAFTEDLLDYYGQHADHWRPNVLNFARNFVRQGLKGRPITRDLDWGIPVPIEGWEDKHLYVWFENIIGYLSASIEWAHQIGKPDAWKQWWYDPSARIYNFLGKDNIPFHAINWQAQLLGVERLAGDGEDVRFNLPYDVAANEFLNIEGKQFSKSRNWAVWLPDILERYDPDAIRYYVAATLPESHDSDWQWSDFVRRNNDELLATWGNLVNRVLSFAHKHWEGRVPDVGELRPVDRQLLAQVEAGFESVGRSIEAVKLRAALQEAIRLARAVNGYLDRTPWFSIVKQDKTEAAKTVYTAIRAIDSIKVLLAPFLPFSSERLHRLLGYQQPLFGQQHIETVQENESAHEVLTYDASNASGCWSPSSGEYLLASTLASPEPLYVKLDELIVEFEQARLGK